MSALSRQPVLPTQRTQAKPSCVKKPSQTASEETTDEFGQTATPASAKIGVGGAGGGFGGQAVDAANMTTSAYGTNPTRTVRTFRLRIDARRQRLGLDAGVRGDRHGRHFPASSARAKPLERVANHAQSLREVPRAPC